MNPQSNLSPILPECVESGPSTLICESVSKGQPAENCNPSNDLTTSNGAEDEVIPILGDPSTWTTPQDSPAVMPSNAMDMPDDFASLVDLHHSYHDNSTGKSEPGAQQAEHELNKSDRSPLEENRCMKAAFYAVKELFDSEFTFLTKIIKIEFVSIDFENF